MTLKVAQFQNDLIKTVFVFLIAFSSFSQDLGGDSNGEDSNDNVYTGYHQNVVGISKNGIAEGPEAMKVLINALYKDDALVSYNTKYIIPVIQKLEYEIGISQTEKGGNYAHIIIWVLENTAKKRILEAVHKMSGNYNIPAELEKTRKKWVTLCNAHDAKKLVEELYTDDAIYYNRGRILIGPEQLSVEYSYMNNPSYGLQLNPKHIEMVSNELIYEIGVCSGSYNLPYILIWKKQPDGAWKIFFDSNY